MPRRLARSASQRAKNVLPAPYSPRTALNTARPEATPSSSASTARSNRSMPTANRSSPACGTVPRRSASTTSPLRAGLTTTGSATGLTSEELMPEQFPVQFHHLPIISCLEHGVAVYVQQSDELRQVAGHADGGLARNGGGLGDSKAAACLGKGVDQPGDARVVRGTADELALSGHPGGRGDTCPQRVRRARRGQAGCW